MILLGSFFNIISSEVKAGKMVADLEIDPSHPIFAGHFPGQPVVPGVCLMEMTREVFEELTGIAVRIPEASHIKFLTVLDPRVHHRVCLSVEYTARGIDSTISAVITTPGLPPNASPLTFFKFKGTFRKETDH